MSPNVDVGITDEKDNQTYAQEDTRQSNVDERLKKLQQEDNNEMFSPELDEKIVLPSQRSQTVSKEKTDASELELRTTENTSQQSHIQDTKQTKETKATETKEKPKEVTPTSHAQTTATTTQMTPSRVVIGSYASEKQAEVAKAALQESGIGVTPIIKNVGGTYTLQVGSYSTREKAQQATNSLIKNNFPARVLE